MTSSNIFLFLLLLFNPVRKCYTGNYHAEIEGTVPPVVQNSKEYHGIPNGEIGNLKSPPPVAHMISNEHGMPIDADESELTTVNSIPILPSLPSESSTNNHEGIIKTILSDLRNHDIPEDIITRTLGNHIDTSALENKYVDEHSTVDKESRQPEQTNDQILQEGKHSQNKHISWSAPISSQPPITPVEAVVPRVMSVPPYDHSTTNIPLSHEIYNPSEALPNSHVNDRKPVEHTFIPVDSQTTGHVNLPENILKTIDDLRANSNKDMSIHTHYPFGNNKMGNIEEHLNRKDNSNCSANEVYIIDGERTLLLTNKKLTADIETMEDQTHYFKAMIENQNKIIFQLKQRLENSEAQGNDGLGLLVKHEQSYQKLLRELNETKSRDSETRMRNENLETKLAQEKEERTHYQQLSNHFKEETDRANVRLNAMMDESNENCEKTIKGLQNKYRICKKEFDEQARTIQGLSYEQNLIKDNLGMFNRTRTHYNKHKCRIMKQQLEGQDEALILLKDQVKTQAHTLESMNRLISMKHDTIENIHNAVNVQLEQQKQAENEYAARDELLLSQQETIKLLKQLKDEHDYLRRARDIALGILQGTVYRMVNNIDSCKSEVVEGLKARIESLEKSQQPLQDMVDKYKNSISQSSKVTQMEQAHNANLKKLLNIRIKTLELMTQEKEAVDATAAFCSGKCNYNPAILSKIDELYRPANEYSCKPICKEIKRKHVSGKEKGQRRREHKLHHHSTKKLPSFMATKQEGKIFDF